MRILWISVSRDGTGWANASNAYMLALDSVGVDVVSRPLRLNNARTELPERIKELEQKSSSGCDIVIQHLLPHHYSFDGNFKKNIALYASETSHFRNSSWADRINSMDITWLINSQMYRAARDSGVTTPIEVVPHTVDIEKFYKSYEPLDVLKPYRESGDFLLYFVGEFTRRKNLQGLLKAFHTEFDPSDPVQLVIKTNKSGMSPDEVRSHTEAFCSEIRRGLKLPGGHHKPEIIITDRLTEHGMMRLHSGCDCFVMPSYGEAWALPCADAMAMGKTPIVSRSTGFLEYMTEDTGWLIETYEEPVFGVDDTFQDIFTGHETWQVPSIMDLRKAMREAFENKELRQKKSAAGIDRASDFSYEVIGERMKSLLESYL